MDLRAALDVLGVPPGAPMEEARAAYRREIRRSHPDLDVARGSTATATHDAAARLNLAWSVVSAAGTTVVADAAPPDRVAAAPASTTPPGPPEAGPAASATASDSIGVAAPAEETFAVMAEAAGRVGDISYIDRQLHILEAIVRFEGGPSCSLLVTLQGRAWGTEALCSLESIEAAPTPPIAPVMDALLEALTSG